jgi:hypothetical protein
VLVLIDMIFPGWVPSSTLALSASARGYIEIHNQILAYPFEHYIGGHQGKAGVRNDVLDNQEYVQDVFNNCKTAITASNTNNPVVGVSQTVPEFLAVNPNNVWRVFNMYYNTVAQLCHNMTSEKWIGRLAGQDVYGFSHAWKMAGDLRLEYAFLGPFGVQPAS